MGNVACKENEETKSRGVLPNGQDVEVIDDDDLPSPVSSIQRNISNGKVIISCGDGHKMKAKIYREVHMQHVIKGMTCPQVAVCSECAKEINVEDAYYVCRACNDYLCLDCAKQQAGAVTTSNPRHLNTSGILNLEQGDIVLVGPTDWGIHHVLLVTSTLTQDPDMLQILKEEPEASHLEWEPHHQLWYAYTIECTQAVQGDDTWWYPTKTYFKRDPMTGDAHAVADWPDGQAVSVSDRELPFKLLLHPLRPSFGGVGVDQALFSNVVEFSAGLAQKYGKQVAVQAWLQARVARAQKKFGIKNRVTLEEYNTPEKREELMEYYELTWKEPPICASVAIKVWQRYFKAMHSKSRDNAMIDIINYMPCWCHRSSPSQMTKDLVACGWLLVDSLEEESTGKLVHMQSSGWFG